MTGRELVALDLPEIKKYVEGIKNFLYVESLGLRQVSQYTAKQKRVIKFPIYQVHSLFTPDTYAMNLYTGDGEITIIYHAKTIMGRLKMKVDSIKR